MDLFAAEHVTPFPDSGDLLFAAGLLSNHQNPQKLRPIRSLPPPPPPGYILQPHPPPKIEPFQASVQEQDPIGSGSGQSMFYRQDSGSSSDDEDDVEDVDNASERTKEFGSRKRRKKTARKLEGFVQNLVKKVMEKQEQMNQELIVMIEKYEKERIMREEAWRREEMERIKKDEEARAQERSRNLALISFVQKILGHEIPIPPIPQPVEVSVKREEDEVEVNNKRDFNGDPSNNRWPDVEVQALITVRTALEHRFGLMGSKGSIWEEISEAMRGMGYNRSAKKCKEKWENINKYYKRTVGSGKKRPINSKTCPYFDELDSLYRNGSLSSGNGLTNSNNVSNSEEKGQSEI